MRRFGWSDEHLHRFVIHGREYGVSHFGGIGFRNDPRRVRLVDFGLRIGERFRAVVVKVCGIHGYRPFFDIAVNTRSGVSGI